MAILGPKKCIFSSFKVFLLELKQKHVLKLGDLKAFLKASLKNFIHNCINTKRNSKSFERKNGSHFEQNATRFWFENALFEIKSAHSAAQ